MINNTCVPKASLNLLHSLVSTDKNEYCPHKVNVLQVIVRSHTLLRMGGSL